ncbi:MAG: hypothetical protein ACR2OV_03510 [Hyphomicrobiaceae bacterium]|jgi:hypothetical protein
MSFLVAVFRAGGIIFLSLVLAAVALVYVGIEHPTALEGMLIQASHFKEVLTDTSYTGLDVRYNVWVKFLLQEQQFVFMFFVILMRILLLVIFSGIPSLYQWLWNVPRSA